MFNNSAAGTGKTFTVPTTAKAGDTIVLLVKDNSGTTKTAAAVVVEQGGTQDEAGVVITGDNFVESTDVAGTIGIASPGSRLIAAYTGKATNLAYQWYCSDKVDGQYVSANGSIVMTLLATRVQSQTKDTLKKQLQH